MTHQLTSWPNVANYMSAMLLIFLAGTNVSFILYAHRVFHPRTTKFWRLFFIGKTIISVVLVEVLIQFPSTPNWRLGLIDVGAFVSLVALIVIFIDRPYVEAIKATQLQEEVEGHAR